MKILLLSDNHNSHIDLDLLSYDLVIHCGDYGLEREYLEKNNVKYVRGNCDYIGPKEITLEFNGKKIYVIHGDIYNVKYNLQRLIYRSMEQNVDYTIFGHTHIPNMVVHDNITLINPGAFKDGYYAVIEDDYVTFYLNNTIYKKFKTSW
jgi:putative phosphoesterase